jgi:hypothetical protein
MGEDVSKRIMGPASATDGNLAAFDGATGKKAKELTAAQAKTFLAITGADVTGVTQIESASRTIYVDADAGSDATGDGSSGSPFQTYSKALSTVRDVIATGVTITILLREATATYTPVDTGRICIGTGKLVIQGEYLAALDTGTADADSTVRLLEDDDQGWSADAYKGKLVHMTSGATSGDYRLIKTNDADTLTVVANFTAEPDDDAFEILDWGTKMSGATWNFVQGTIDVNDICCPSLSAGAKFACVVGTVSLTLTRCSAIAGGAGCYGLSCSTGTPVISLASCVFNGNSNTQLGAIVSTPGALVTFSSCYIYGFTGPNPTINIKDFTSCAIIAGGVYDGTVSATPTGVVVLERQCNLHCWNSSDKPEIVGDASNTYGMTGGTGANGAFVNGYVTFTVSGGCGTYSPTTLSADGSYIG